MAENCERAKCLDFLRDWYCPIRNDYRVLGMCWCLEWWVSQRRRHAPDPRTTHGSLHMQILARLDESPLVFPDDLPLSQLHMLIPSIIVSATTDIAICYGTTNASGDQCAFYSLRVLLSESWWMKLLTPQNWLSFVAPWSRKNNNNTLKVRNKLLK